MAQDDDLSPATRDEVISTLSLALRFAGRKRDHPADGVMARSGFVISKRPLSGGLAHLDPCLLGPTA